MIEILLVQWDVDYCRFLSIYLFSYSTEPLDICFPQSAPLFSVCCHPFSSRFYLQVAHPFHMGSSSTSFMFQSQISILILLLPVQHLFLSARFGCNICLSFGLCAFIILSMLDFGRVIDHTFSATHHHFCRYPVFIWSFVFSFSSLSSLFPNSLFLVVVLNLCSLLSLGVS